MTSIRDAWTQAVNFHQARQHAQAENLYRAILQQYPRHIKALQMLGIVGFQTGRQDLAESCLREVIRLKPDHAEAHSILGNVLTQQARIEEAIANFREAVRLKPDYPSAYNDLGIVLIQVGNLPEAEACFHKAIELRPGFAEAHYGLGQIYLSQGDFARGWAEYEWRWGWTRFRELFAPRTTTPLWDGSPLDGKTILLACEQGIGDTLQFVRYAALVKARGGRVVVTGRRPLLGLLKSCPGIDDAATPDADVPHDVHQALMSLPRIFGTTLHSIPAPVPYVTVPMEFQEKWQRALAGATAFKVGISWQSSSALMCDQFRSIPLKQFIALGRVQGVQFFSLHKEHGREQLPGVADELPVIDLADELGDFAMTGALMKNLDLVITADNVNAHLAGALTVPVWVALPYAADWRWLRQRDDSPWYPTMRLFRQPSPGAWDEVFDRLATELQTLVR